MIMPPFNGEQETYLYSKIEKDSLLRFTKEPRIILIGGSNLALGINSQILKDSLQLNPVNTGLDCNIGLVSMINNAKPYIRKGDKVVICLEFEQFFDRKIYGGYPLPIIEFSVSKGKNIMNLDGSQIYNMLKELPSYSLSKLKFWHYFYNSFEGSSRNFKRNSFNTFGDHITHWGSNSLNPIPTHSLGKQFNPEIITTLLEFNDFLSEKNAELLISYPPLQRSTYKLNKNDLDYINNILHKSNLIIISKLENYIMSDSLMFDSPYHVIKNGVDIRTLKLIHDIKAN